MPKPDPNRFTETQLLGLCGSALDKYERLGERANTVLSTDEIDALVCYVVGTGGVPACRDAFHQMLGERVAAQRAAEGAL